MQMGQRMSTMHMGNRQSTMHMGNRQSAMHMANRQSAMHMAQRPSAMHMGQRQSNMQMRLNAPGKTSKWYLGFIFGALVDTELTLFLRVVELPRNCRVAILFHSLLGLSGLSISLKICTVWFFSVCLDRSSSPFLWCVRRQSSQQYDKTNRSDKALLKKKFPLNLKMTSTDPDCRIVNHKVYFHSSSSIMSTLSLSQRKTKMLGRVKA